MMESLVNNNIFTGYKVGRDHALNIFHLQFAYDTLIVGNKSWVNVRAMHAVLHLFEAMSGLKVNFQKSELVGVNVSRSWLFEAAIVLNCKVSSLPIMYLGLPVDVDSRRLHFWEPVVNHIKSHLSSWKSKYLSFSGCLVLLKSVLTSLLVYALSFFKTPLGIISSIDSLLIRFFLGGGGLGVRRLREFNLALLGKWCWRQVTYREGLWFRLLAARYGLECGHLLAGGREGSLWWREIVRIRDCLGSVFGNWYADNVRLKIGNGLNTLFWLDMWLGEVPLRVRYPRLYELSENKLLNVAQMYALCGMREERRESGE